MKIFYSRRSVHTQENQRAGNVDEARMIAVLRKQQGKPVVHVSCNPRLLRVTSIHITILRAPIQMCNGGVEC